jgi:hypothetical protein
MEISEGDTPEIRDACPIDLGLILCNFSLDSVEIVFNFK